MYLLISTIEAWILSLNESRDSRLKTSKVISGMFSSTNKFKLVSDSPFPIS